MKKETYCILASTVLIVAGIGFGIAAFCTPPPGQISDSVLILIAQCFIMSGSFVGIDALILKAMHGRNKENNSK